MSDNDAIPPVTRLLAMSAHLSVFTCLPVFLLPMYGSSHPFANAHGAWAGQWYAWFLLACVLCGILTAGTLGMGAVLFLLPLLIWVVGFVGLGYAVVGWMPPTWLSAKYTTDAERKAAAERKRRR